MQHDYWPYVTLEDLNRDHLLSIALDNGLIVLNDGKASPYHVEPDSGIEREVRAAVARLLHAGSRNNCGRRCRSMAELACSVLARLLDPENKDEPFELVLRRRRGRKGPVLNPAFDSMIGWYIANQIPRYSDRQRRGQMKAAIDDAVKTFDVSRATAYSAWKKYRPKNKDVPKVGQARTGMSKIEPTI
jgi:hypothetical protein